MERAAAIHILLVDDYAPFRKGFRGMLESDPAISIVAEADCARQAIELARTYRPDIALVDVRMKGMNGIESIPLIRAASPDTAVMIFTMYGDSHYVSRSFQSGARGFLLKDASQETLLQAIHAVHAGGSYCTPELMQYAKR